MTAVILHDKALADYGGRLCKSLRANAVRKTISTKDGSKIQYDEFLAAASKSMIDSIDGLLARKFGLGVEELDFVINYDIKFRVGADAL